MGRWGGVTRTEKGLKGPEAQQPTRARGGRSQRWGGPAHTVTALPPAPLPSLQRGDVLKGALEAQAGPRPPQGLGPPCHRGSPWYLEATTPISEQLTTEKPKRVSQTLHDSVTVSREAMAFQAPLANLGCPQAISSSCAPNTRSTSVGLSCHGTLVEKSLLYLTL